MQDLPPPPPPPLPPDRAYRGLANPETGVLDFALSHGWNTFTRAWGLLVVAGLVIIVSGMPPQFGWQFAGPGIRATIAVFGLAVELSSRTFLICSKALVVVL